ncbi:SirB1 family protein [[Phormidium] sp. ETS-05]|uniref:SirB1 family protein n=1 Tax=[Phormidium] sp. ETS-05 TaxID=222819 RepID=UPI0018EEF908|nr:tetratricopeptide repeat protein [[Phormidium] sp. ETS-05]
MKFSLARQLFYQEIHQNDEDIDLGKAALYIAGEEYPHLDYEEYLNALDVMASEVAERLPQQRYPLRVIQTINSYLYDDFGFRGNEEDYYNPRNSFLNEVIDKRRGIPITLSLVYLEVARRIDFPMVGIGMPGHFLIRPDFEDAGIFVDAFHRGEVLFPDDCQQRLNDIYHRPVQWQSEFLAAVSKRQFLARMLGNLKMIYLQVGELGKCLGAVERILLLFPNAPLELRDRGLLYYQSDRPTEARSDLETYLQLLPNAPDAGIIRQVLDKINS